MTRGALQPPMHLRGGVRSVYIYNSTIGPSPPRSFVIQKSSLVFKILALMRRTGKSANDAIHAVHCELDPDKPAAILRRLASSSVAGVCGRDQAQEIGPVGLHRHWPPQRSGDCENSQPRKFDGHRCGHFRRARQEPLATSLLVLLPPREKSIDVKSCCATLRYSLL